MRITGSAGSYGSVRLGNPYVRVIHGMPVRNSTSSDVLVTCKRVVYRFSTGFLQFRDDVLAKGSHEPVRLPYGYRTVTVRCITGPYGACASTVRIYVLENTRRILRSLYVAHTGPGDGRECTYEFLASYDCLRAFYGGKKLCACTTFRHGLLTGIGGLYGLKKTVELRAGP